MWGQAEGGGSETRRTIDERGLKAEQRARVVGRWGGRGEEVFGDGCREEKNGAHPMRSARR